MSITPFAHSAESVRAAAEEFLLLLDENDEPDQDGYYQSHPSSRCFAPLIEDHPGAWDALVRNLTFGLDRFPPGRVLDIGCGHGLQSFVFARHGHEVTGLDTAELRVKVANRIAAAADMPWLEYRAGNARDQVGKLGGAALWMHRSFHHIPRRTDYDASARQYFRQVHQSLDDGGVLIFMTSNPASRALLPWVSQGSTDRPIGRIIELVQQAGFEVHDFSFQGYLTVLPISIRPRSSTKIDSILARTPGVRRLGGTYSIAAHKV